MTTIWKFTIPIIDDSFVLETPKMFKPLHFALQGDTPTLWAYVAPGTTVKRRFYIVGTGHPAGHVFPGDHIGTLQQGGLVWHLFWNMDPIDAAG